MEVKIVSTTTMANSATTTTIPLTVFDMLAADMHVAILYAFSAPVPSNEVLKRGLCDALAHYPTLVGEFKKDDAGRPCVVSGGGGGGVLVVEAEVESKLAEFVPSPELWRLHPSVQEPVHVFQVQLNRFKCGGLVIGLSSHHRVADGLSMSNFLVAWGRAAQGLNIEPLPVYDVSSMKPRQPPRCDYQHWGVEFHHPSTKDRVGFSSLKEEAQPSSICNVRLNYTSEFISTHLKSKIPSNPTTFVSLLAHLWVKITTCRKLKPDATTRIRVAVNGRRRLDPPTPFEFFGNLVINAFPTTKVEDLLNGGTPRAVVLIHEAIVSINDNYIRSLIDFGEINKIDDLVPMSEGEGMILCPNLEVDSWLGLGFGEVDFGCGNQLCGFSPTWIPVEGIIVFSSEIGKKGDVSVNISLSEEHAKVLREISHYVDD